MNKEEAQKYLRVLGESLQQRHLMGEILVNDGVVVLLDIGKPEEQVDIDAYMAYLKGEGPKVKRQTGVEAYFKGNGIVIHEAVTSIAVRERLPDSWLDDALQLLFFAPSSQERWLEYQGLRAHIAPLEYMLTMKIAVAEGQEDDEEIVLMAKKLGIKDAQEMLKIIRKYLPEQLLTANIQMVVEKTFL
jgi:hypothetical protein